MSPWPHAGSRSKVRGGKPSTGVTTRPQPTAVHQSPPSVPELTRLEAPDSPVKSVRYSTGAIKTRNETKKIITEAWRGPNRGSRPRGSRCSRSATSGPMQPRDQLCFLLQGRLPRSSSCSSVLPGSPPSAQDAVPLPPGSPPPQGPHPDPPSTPAHPPIGLGSEETEETTRRKLDLAIPPRVME